MVEWGLMEDAKQEVYAFWEKASCGEELYLSKQNRDGYMQQAKIRYELEPYILDFADFKKYKGKRVLEIGVGLGADHQMFAESGAVLHGIDLTRRAIDNTAKRFQVFGLNSNLQVSDAERLPFSNDYFDMVYSWGVLHHTPDTEKAINEVLRVLKPGGEVKCMIYYKYSFVGYMLWLRYALLKFKPFTSLNTIYAQYLESPGTKAYSNREAEKLFSCFSDLKIKTILTHGDLLTSYIGQRHRGLVLSFAKLIWPRWIIKTFFPNNGLFMLITAKKS